MNASFDDKEGAQADPLRFRPEFQLLDSTAHLMRRAHFYGESLFSSIFARYDITSRQMVLLIAILKNPGASQKTIGDAVALDMNTVSDTLRRMERKDLVRRVASTTDGRSIALDLTDKSRALVEEALPDFRRFNDALSMRLSADEAQQLRRLLRKMLNL